MPKTKQVIPEKCLGYKMGSADAEITARDAIVYALGVGYSKDPLNKDDLQYTYELHEDFKVCPTYSTCIGNMSPFDALQECPGFPEFNPMMLLHAEQRTEIYEPLSPDTKLRCEGEICNIADKGKMTLVQFKVNSFDESNKLLFSNYMNLMIRGVGGFGFKGKPFQQMPKAPQRNPDKVAEQMTEPNQAILYRLSGDYNPLHIDQNMAAMGGFERPILHGLCFYGISSKIIAQNFCKGDQDQVKAVQARFTSSVYPGETLVYKMWKQNNTIVFTASTKERGKDVIQGVVELVAEAKL